MQWVRRRHTKRPYKGSDLVAPLVYHSLLTLPIIGGLTSIVDAANKWPSTYGIAGTSGSLMAAPEAALYDSSSQGSNTDDSHSK